MSDLTKTGWPRPIVDGHPVPWVSPSRDLASMSPARLAACASGAICAVCGEGYSEGEPAFVLVKADEEPDPLTRDIRPMDSAIMHERCVRLALRACPKLLELQRAGELRIARTVGNCAEIDRHEDGQLHPRIEAGDWCWDAQASKWIALG